MGSWNVTGAVGGVTLGAGGGSSDAIAAPSIAFTVGSVSESADNRELRTTGSVCSSPSYDVARAGITTPALSSSTHTYGTPLKGLADAPAHRQRTSLSNQHLANHAKSHSSGSIQYNAVQWSHLVRTAPRPACDVDHQQGIRSSRTACAGKEPRDDKPSGKAKLQGVTKVCSASPMYPARVPKHYVRQVVQLGSATQQGRASLTDDPHFLLHNTHDSRHVSRGLKAKCDFRKTDSYPGVAPQSERV